MTKKKFNCIVAITVAIGVGWVLVTFGFKLAAIWTTGTVSANLGDTAAMLGGVGFVLAFAAGSALTIMGEEVRDG